MRLAGTRALRAATYAVSACSRVRSAQRPGRGQPTALRVWLPAPIRVSRFAAGQESQRTCLRSSSEPERTGRASARAERRREALGRHSSSEGEEHQGRHSCRRGKEEIQKKAWTTWDDRSACSPSRGLSAWVGTATTTGSTIAKNATREAFDDLQRNVERGAGDRKSVV